MTAPQPLTPAIRRLLKDLTFRLPEATPCWTVNATHDKFAFFIPIAVAGGPRLEYLRTFNGKTIRAADRAGLVTISKFTLDVPPLTNLPSVLAGRRVFAGSTITLTDAGKAAIGVATASP